MQALVEPAEHPREDAVTHDFIESFAGEKSVSRALRGLGYRGYSLDVRSSRTHDVLTPEGVHLLLLQVLRLRRGGVLWCAPPCSSWIFMSRGSTGRTPDEPWGNVASKYILAQDALVERLVLALEICTLRGAWWIIEQPANAIMWLYPAVRERMARHQVKPLRLEMGAYGGSSRKPTHLVGTAPYLPSLQRSCTGPEREALRSYGVRTAHTYTDSKGRKRCAGSKDLKATQAYPDGFGSAHALAFRDAQQLNFPEGMDVPVGTAELRAISTLLLPAAVRQALRDAWWLRDINGGLRFESRAENEKLPSSSSSSDDSRSRSPLRR